MPNLINQKVLRITDKTKGKNIPEFITEDVVEVRRAKLIYYKWICRLMAILTTLSLFFGVCAVLVILKLVPQIVYDAQIFVQLSDSQSIIKREYIERRMESREKIMINFMKQYVELRNTYIKDRDEMRKRWLWGGLVSYLSTYKVYQEFAKTYPKFRAEMEENNSSRSVEILSVKRTGGENSYIWTVEFKTYDFSYDDNEYETKNIGPKIKIRYWTTNIKCYADPKRKLAYRRLINPLGFVVSSYFQSEIEN